MKKQHILSICIAGALLTACGSGSNGNSQGIKDNNSNIAPPHNSSTTDNGANTNGTNNNNSADNGTNTDNGANNSNQTPSNGKLPYEHKVPKELQEAVEKALTLPAPEDEKFSATIGDKNYGKGDSLNLTDFDLGLTKTNYTISDEEETSKGELKIYRQHYSALMNLLPTDTKLSSDNSEEYTDTLVITGNPGGYTTQNMPETGKATYKGKSFYQQEEGDFNLAVNFGENTVKGEITGLSVGTVALEETQYISFKHDEEETAQFGYKGVATPHNSNLTVKMATRTQNGMEVTNKDFTANKYNFIYEGRFFGPKAEETGGVVYTEPKFGSNEDDDYIDILNFAGQRGEIKK